MFKIDKLYCNFLKTAVQGDVTEVELLKRVLGIRVFIIVA